MVCNLAAPFEEPWSANINTTRMARTTNSFVDISSSDSSEDEDRDGFLQDPNADEFEDFRPWKRRRTGRDPKERAALGVFGSESEDEKPSQLWKSKNMRAKGMAFVKSGQDGELDVDSDGIEDDGDVSLARPQGEQGAQDIDMDYDTEEGAYSRLGMQSHNESETLTQSPTTSGIGLGATNSSLFGRGFVPSSANIPILKVEDEKISEKRAMPSAFSTPRANKGGKASAINANSFAARMMAKMGYKEGQGLGKEGQGRSGVIDVQLRPQRAGLGAVKEKSKQEREEERRQSALRGEVLEDSDEGKKKLHRKVKADSGTGTPRRRQKPKYQSLSELQRAAPGLHIPEAFTPILDMTGPGQRLLTSTSGLLTAPTEAEPSELVEAKKLARRAQNDLESFVEEWKNLEERKAWIEMEILQHQQIIDDQKSLSDKMSLVARTVEGLAQFVMDGQWDSVIKTLKMVDDLTVTRNDEISSIAVAAVHPFFRQFTEGWLPLNDPKLSNVSESGLMSSLYNIRELLGMNSEGKSRNSLSLRRASAIDGPRAYRSHKTTPYESLMYTVWFPKVRSAITNNWDVYDPAPLQNLLEAWEGLVPSFIHSQIIDQLVVRKLGDAVANWNPKKKRSVPLPHLWLFPWLQYLEAHHSDPKSPTGLVSEVKRKFRQLIDGWDFRRGVIPGLEQWKAVLQAEGYSDQWSPLIMNHVLPNLARFLRTKFQVAPQDQAPFLPYLHSTFEWLNILGPQIMGQLMVDEMFPMWHDVLHQWLTLDSVNYLEIRDWLVFWQGLIPHDIGAVPAVKAEWKRGDDLINQALDLGPRAKSELPALVRARKPPTDNDDKDSRKRNAPVKAAATVEPVTLRQQVEDWCLSHELQFIAEKEMLDANGPVYRVTAAPAGKGGVLIYLRGNALYAQIKRGVWSNLGSEMDALFELAHRT